MAYLVSGSGGLSFVAASSSVEEKKYSPVYGEELDLSFIWDSLPDFYSRYMLSQEYLTAVWSGAAQVLSSELLHLYETDYAKSLRDIPFSSQRKWFKIGLETSLDLDTDPDFSTFGFPDFKYSSSAIQGLFTIRSGISSRYYKKLDGTAAEDGSLIWYADLTVTAADASSIALVGYAKEESALMETTLASGIHSYAGNLRLIIVHGFNAASEVSKAIGSENLSLNTKYRVRSEYSSSTFTVTTTLTELRKQRLSSTTGYTATSTDSVTTTLFDDSQDFVASGVQVGDFIVFDGIDHEIVTVATTYLVVAFASLPTSATGISYEIVGESSVESLSLNLLTESERSFSVDSFGLISGEAYMLRALVPFPSAKMTVTVDELYFIDPSVDQVLIDLPKLQTSPTATPTKDIGLDYLISTGQVSFTTPTSGEWYAEFGLFDEGRVYDNFGANVPLTKETASEDYLNKVRGLHYALFSGPTIHSIRTGVLASVGLPIAIEGGTVSQINTAYSGERGQIVVAGRSYLYPLSVGTSLSVGDTVRQFDPLSDGVVISDYISNPTWFDAFSFVEEVQKYHTFLVTVDLDAFDSSSIGAASAIKQASTTLDLIKPTYKDFLLVGSRDLEDSESITDAIVLSPTLFVADAMSEPYPVYDDRRFFPPAYDWAYDQGQTAWDEIPASVAYFAYKNTETKPWNGTSSQSKFLTGGTVEINEDESFIEDASGAFISELGRLCSEFSTNGIISGTTFTANTNERFLTSIPNTYGSGGGLPTGMVIKVVVSDGSSTYAVYTATDIDNENQLTLDGSPTAISGATYEVRISGPVGGIYSQDLGLNSSSTGTNFTDASGAFTTSIPHDGGTPKVPTNPTFVFADPFQEDPAKYLRQVSEITNNTTLVVSSAFGTPNLSGVNSIVFTPRTAIAASPGVDATSGSTTTNTFVADTSTSVLSSTGGVFTTTGLRDGANPFNDEKNISEGFGLEITSPSLGAFAIIGLVESGGNNHIRTSTTMPTTGSATYEVFRGAFQDVLAGDLLVVESGANAGIYTITGVSSSTAIKGRDTITISGAFPSPNASPSSTTGYVYRVANLWARLAHVDSDTKIYTTTVWPGDGKTSASDSGGGGVFGPGEVTYADEKKFAYLSEVDLTALEVFYDQAEELSPDEEVVLQWEPTVGYGGTLLTYAGNHEIFTTDTTNTDEVDHTVSIGTLSAIPSAGDVIILPDGRAREVVSYVSPTITLVGTHSGRDKDGNLVNKPLYLIPLTSVATAGTDFTFTGGSANVVVAGSLSGATLSPGDLIQPLLPSGSDNTVSLPVVEIATVPGSYPGTITLTSNYTGDSIATTKVVVRSTADIASDLGSYYNLTDADFHNVEIPGAAQTITHVIPENTFL